MEKEQKITAMGEQDSELPSVSSRELRVLLVEPEKAPRTAVIPNNLDGLQTAVGGMIEIVDLDDKTCLVCNEEGKLLGLPGNRRVGEEKSRSSDSLRRICPPYSIRLSSSPYPAPWIFRLFCPNCLRS